MRAPATSTCFCRYRGSQERFSREGEGPALSEAASRRIRRCALAKEIAQYLGRNTGELLQNGHAPFGTRLWSRAPSRTSPEVVMAPTRCAVRVHRAEGGTDECITYCTAKAA